MMVTASQDRPLISLVMPCFNEEEVLAITLQQWRDYCQTQSDCDFELILVDDGSDDRTFTIIRDAATEDTRLRVIRLSRNFGHQIAITAGIDAARGDAVIPIDADLQDPLEIITTMIEEWRRGADVVYGVRVQRDGETAFKRLSAKLFYRVLGALADVAIPYDSGDFRLMSRTVVDALKAMPERHRFIRGMVSWVGFNQVPVYYNRDERRAGITKYPLRSQIKLATNGIFSFSTLPLKFAKWIGIVTAMGAFACIIYVLLVRLLSDHWVPGWATLIIAVLMFGGIQLIALGLIGDYIGLLYEEAKRRPLYLVREQCGFPGNGKGEEKRRFSHDAQ